MKPRLLQILGALAGLAAVGSLFYPNLSAFLTRQTDFMPLYVAATIVDTRDLYDPAPYEEYESQNFKIQTRIRYTRLPFYAKLLQPLAEFNYWQAYLVFTLFRLLAVAMFVLLWKLPDRPSAVLYTCWSFPLFASLLGGQDVIFPVFGMALAVHFYSRGMKFAAGLAMTLFAIKFHLFLLTPLTLLEKARRTVAYGFITGIVALCAANVWISGWDWPVKFLAAAASSTQNPGVALMPNLHGLLLGLPRAELLEASTDLIVLVLAWAAVRKADFTVGLAICTWGSLLVCYHAYVADTLVLLPALLSLTTIYGPTWSKLTNLVILTPPISLALLSGRPASFVSQAVISAAFVAAAAFTARTEPLSDPRAISARD